MSLSAEIAPESSPIAMTLYIDEIVRFAEGVKPDEPVVARLHEEAAAKVASLFWGSKVHLVVIRCAPVILQHA